MEKMFNMLNEETKIMNVTHLQSLLNKTRTAKQRGLAKKLQFPLVVINVTNTEELERGFDNLKTLSGK